MNRLIIMISIITLITTASLAAPNSGYEENSGDAMSYSLNQPVSLLFVQSAEKGEFIAESDGMYKLTLEQAVPYSFYFSDRPDRIAGSISNEKFFKNMNWTPAPNAAITLPDGNKSEDAIIVELMDPRYDSRSGNITYTVRIVRDYMQGKISDLLPDIMKKYLVNLAELPSS